jgi:PAS domain S-box-containing protein
VTDLNTLRLQAFAVTSDGVVITDTSGVVIWANAAMEQLTGYPPEELIGEKPGVLKSGQDPEVYANLWETVSAGQVWSGQIVNKRKDDTLYYELMTINPMRDSSGEIAHYVAVKRDVSSLVRAEIARDRLLTVSGRLRETARDSIETCLTTLADAADLVDPKLGLHGRRVGELACRIAVHLNLNVDHIREIRLAGLTHDLGKLATGGQSAAAEPRHLHAMGAAALLESIPGIEPIQEGVRHHHERYDGTGFPDGLKGLSIPLPARVIAVASGYDNARYGLRRSQEDALALMDRRRDSLYDPRLVDLLHLVVAEDDGAFAHEGTLVAISRLSPGMTLAGDLCSSKGALLYPNGTEVTYASARKLTGLEKSGGIQPFVRVQRPRAPGPHKAGAWPTRTSAPPSRGG